MMVDLVHMQFKQLAAHMANKHPEFHPEIVGGAEHDGRKKRA